MKSIFDLPQSVSELPALNQGMSRLTYEQVPPLKNVQGTGFPGGRIEHRWEVSGNRWWIPSRSYIRLRAKLTNGDGSAIIADSLGATGGDKAPNMGVMGNLFQSMEFKIAQKVVSRISDRVAQVDALYNRLNYSKSQLDSWGAGTNWWQPDFDTRSNLISQDGLIVNQINYSNRSVETAAFIDFDIATPNNASYTAATKTLTFIVNGGAAIDIRNNQILHIGDRVIGVGGNFNNNIYEITEIIDGLTCHADQLNAAEADVAAETVGNLEFELASAQKNNKSPQKSELEFIWKPPLGIFSCPYALPAGRYELSMIPQNSAEYMKKAIESFQADINQRSQLDNNGLISDIQFEVIDLNFYVATTEGPRVDDLTYMIDIEDINCQVENVTGGGFQQKNFDVEPSTTALTIAWQQQSAGLNTLHSQSKFKFLSSNPEFDSGELALKRFFVRYGLDQKPSPDYDPDYEGNKSYITELYAETQLYSGQKFNDGAPESQQDWIDRGPYLYFAWPRDATDEATRVNINYQFDDSVTVTNVARTLLFNHYKNVAMITVKDGRVVDVVLQQG